MRVVRLLSEHSKLRLLGNDLVALVSTAEVCDFDELARRRWDLARTVHLHLAYEDRQLFVPLDSDPRPHVRAAAAAAKRGVEQLHALYTAHVEHWGDHEVTARWGEFQVAVKVMVARMIAKLDREETDLFPLVADDDDIVGCWQPGMRNWAGDGVALKPLIEATGGRQPAHGQVTVDHAPLSPS
ncbi:hemerythrin domain-containing protein [Sphingomonas oligophenolica]|uniref:Hemerythrin-like domain-containing protein n=1 Tax=Sphingomonas oligophenolica TaxID=301154 RepID=A0A502CNS0_9SPHN|nr:hemerythrin domain-containing protein [Sphingomonas oligophenolica]TPG14294.1 hypothetical protein EAH84_02965 [Sphingomonas oligophenolica]